MTLFKISRNKATAKIITNKVNGCAKIIMAVNSLMHKISIETEKKRKIRQFAVFKQ